MEGFHAGLMKGRLTRPPDAYLDLVVIPAVLHVDPLRLVAEYPPALRAALRAWVMHWLAGGQGLNLDVIERQHG